MDILILGNGFDLAHGLNTKYVDFLKHCAKQLRNLLTYKPTDPFFTNMWIRHFLNIQQQLGDTWINLENEIYNVIKHISKLPFLNSLSCYRTFSIDFNNMIFNFYNFDKYTNEVPGGYKAGENEYIRYNEHNFINYIIYFSSSKGIINFLYDQLREFTKLFNYYLLNEVLAPLQNESQYQLSLKSIGVGKGNKDVHVLSFNYTDTCKRLYDQKFNVYCNINIKPVYVHGQVCKSKNCNLVLGTHSFFNSLPNDLNEEINVEFNIFKKHYQRHRYETIESYQDLLRKIKKTCSIPIFHIIGHSLDSADHNILKHILLANPNSIINIYYHNKEAQERLMHKINSIIGEEEVMAKVRFIDQHDAKRGILIPQEKLQNV